MSKEEDDHVSFSSLILSLCRVHGRERPVWSCGVVEWIGRPLISPTPNPGHRQVTTGRRTDFGVKKSSDFSDAGRRTDFRDKNRELFSGEFFCGELFSGAALLPENFVPINVCGVDSFSPN